MAWGDSLFRRDTMESVNEALQVYVLANHILGPRPEFVPKRGNIAAESYDSLSGQWDDFSNALVELENLFPFSSDVSVSEPSVGNNLLGVGSALYFCIPTNEKLLANWDTVADRLFKIRHCQNIDGVERKLALFAPPIDPAALIQATSQGLSLGSILADLSSPPPIYRFTYLIQKTNEFCNDVKALGNALLAVIERGEGEELSRLRAAQETTMQELITAIRRRQVLDAKAGKANIEKVREAAEQRMQHYLDLLGESLTVPASPTVSANLRDNSQLPVDTNIPRLETDVDAALAESDEAGVKLIPREMEDLSKSFEGMVSHQVAAAMEGVAGLMNFIPNFSFEGEPFGVGGSISFGGSNIGGGISGLAKIPQIIGNVMLHEASQAAKMASFIRREQDWTLQANTAAREIINLDKQITSADIQIQIAEKELHNHQQRIDDAKAIEQFLQDKFSNQELYQWMKEQLFAVYKQSYNLAFEMAKKCEIAFKFERGTETASYIQYGYWDNTQQGLSSGEKLQLALRQLEKAYVDENHRELELTKSISMALINPLALLSLKETGQCYLPIPEEVFDADFQGHYFRRIRSVSVSIPAIAGPFATVNCTLRLLSNKFRINTSMNSEGSYEHENDEGLLIDDLRFHSSNTPVKAIATSNAQNDRGMFDFSFRDERYLPFEGAGAISDWQLELTTEEELRQFDYSTINDVILTINYTARENGGLFKEAATDYIKDYLQNAADLNDQPLLRMYPMSQEFPTEWYRFLNPDAAGAEQLFQFSLSTERFPFFARDRDIVIMKAEVFAKCSQAGDYHAVLEYTNHDGDVVTSSQIALPKDASFGDLNRTTIQVTDAGLNLEEVDINGAMSLKLKHNAAVDYTSLAVSPDEVEEIYMVVHYKLG